MTPSIAPATPMTSTDELAHEKASYVRTAVKSTPAPMPGRLSVSYYTDLGDASKPLNQIADRTYVSAIGTVSHVTATAIMITGTDGNTAHCTISAETRQNYAASLNVGTRVMARGMVRHLPDGQRVIDATAVHNLDRGFTQLQER